MATNGAMQLGEAQLKRSHLGTRCPTLTLYRSDPGGFRVCPADIVRCHRDSNSSYMWLFVALVAKDSKLQGACLLLQDSALFIPALECTQTCVSNLWKPSTQHVFPSWSLVLLRQGFSKGWCYSPEISSFLWDSAQRSDQIRQEMCTVEVKNNNNF